jgi:hypothetical protein
MFRFLFQVTFIRRVLQFRFVRLLLILVFAGAVIAGLIYASVVFHALTERNQAPHVQHNSTH